MCLAGGLTHCKKIAAVAESYHCAVVTHNFWGPVLLTTASAHLDTCIPNFLVQEYSDRDEDPEYAIFKTDVRRVGGYMPIPESPGLGVELDEDLLAKTTFEKIDIAFSLRADWSVARSV